MHAAATCTQNSSDTDDSPSGSSPERDMAAEQ